MASRSLSRSISRSRSRTLASRSRSRSASRSNSRSRSPAPRSKNGHHDRDRDDQNQDGLKIENQNERKERELAEKLRLRAVESRNGKSSKDDRGRSRARSVSPLSHGGSRSRSTSRSRSRSPSRSPLPIDRSRSPSPRNHDSSRRSSKRHSSSAKESKRRRGKRDSGRSERRSGREREEGGYDSDDLFNPKRLKSTETGGRNERRSGSERKSMEVDVDQMDDQEREDYRERRRRELDERDREFERQRQVSSLSGTKRHADDGRSPRARPYGGGGGGRRRGGDSYRASRERDDGYSRRPRRESRSPPPARSRSPPRRSARDDDHSPMGGKTFRSAAEQEDYESRSLFCSQLAVRLGQRDLGEFFEEELGEGAVRDVKIVTDRFTGRSKGIGYVELDAASLTEKAIALSGQKLFGIPILVQRSDAERNRYPTSTEEGGVIHRPNMPQYAIPAIGNIPLPPHFSGSGAPIRLGMEGVAAGAKSLNNGARLYVGSLHFDLTEENIRAVFEPFGGIDDVELHKEPGTGKSKGFAFIQFRDAAEAESALQAMNGFELAGRNIKVGHVSSRGNTGSGGGGGGGGMDSSNDGGSLPQKISGLDEGLGSGKMSASSRADLMEKLARGETNSIGLPSKPEENQEQSRPSTIPENVSKALLLKNMFDPSEEFERDWDLELTEDVKEECETKYGKVEKLYVEKESAGEIYVKFQDEVSAGKALNALNGRWFGGKPITASYISEAFFTAKLG